jgi:GAF domain-containing protein
MTNPVDKSVSAKSGIYALRGVAFGFLFPIIATVIKVVSLNLSLNLTNSLKIQSFEPLLWVIDTAPFFLGLFAYFVGRRRDDLEITLNELHKREQELKIVKSNLEKSVEERTSELRLRSEELRVRSEELTRRTQELEEANRNALRRTALLQTLAESARSIATVQNLNDLLPKITRMISEKFGFYHVGIFLIDEAKEYAMLSAANSEGGQHMLARGHRLKIGQVGIVGYVTGTGLPRVALDTGKDAIYFNNPDLPNTHSEMALPLRSGNQVIGALDVQSTERDTFTQEDLEALSTLADQVSIAIQNARLFDETRKSLIEAETIYRQFLHREWGQMKEQGLPGFRYTITGALPLDTPLDLPQIQQVAQTGEIIAEAEMDESGIASLSVPIKLRNEVIGVLNVRAPGKRSWTRDEIDMARTVADRVAISAENARLFEETTNRAERERKVADITNKIRSTNDPQEMIRTALEELKRALKVNRVQIVPYNGQGKNQSAEPGSE